MCKVIDHGKYCEYFISYVNFLGMFRYLQCIWRSSIFFPFVKTANPRSCHHQHHVTASSYPISTPFNSNICSSVVTGDVGCFSFSGRLNLEAGFGKGDAPASGSKVRFESRERREGGGGRSGGGEIVSQRLRRRSQQNNGIPGRRIFRTLKKDIDFAIQITSSKQSQTDYCCNLKSYSPIVFHLKHPFNSPIPIPATTLPATTLPDESLPPSPVHTLREK